MGTTKDWIDVQAALERPLNSGCGMEVRMYQLPLPPTYTQVLHHINLLDESSPFFNSESYLNSLVNSTSMQNLSISFSQLSHTKMLVSRDNTPLPLIYMDSLSTLSPKCICCRHPSTRTVHWLG